MISTETRTTFTLVSNAGLSKLITSKELRSIAKLLGVVLKGDARKKGVKYGWVRQIKSAMESQGLLFT